MSESSVLMSKLWLGPVLKTCVTVPWYYECLFMRKARSSCYISMLPHKNSDNLCQPSSTMWNPSLNYLFQKHITYFNICKNLTLTCILFHFLIQFFVQLTPVCLPPFAGQLSWLLTKWAICFTQVTITIYQIVFPCSLGSSGAHSATSGLLSAPSSRLKRFHAALQSMEPVKRQASLPNSLH